VKPPNLAVKSCFGECRLAALEKQSAEERDRFRDLGERLFRTEQFAEETIASESKLKTQLTSVEQALEVTARICGHWIAHAKAPFSSCH